MNGFTIYKDGSAATIHPFGATIISWKIAHVEKLFVSSKAIWDGSKPIRGGIPIVFPQFGTGRLMEGQHGFARRQVWNLEKISDSEAICTLTHNESTLKEWPYKFKLIYRISVEQKRLLTKLEVHNPPDGNTFAFHALLHTYFAVKDIDNVRVQGLKSIRYGDKLQNGALQIEGEKDIKIESEVDRMYLVTPPSVTLAEGQRRIILRKTGFPEIVLWNPWIEKSKTLNDFDDEEYKTMICVEPGYVSEPFTLRPGTIWMAEQLLESCP